MAQIIFFEKPGCINNTRQKKLLLQAGHTVIAKDLLRENWAEHPEHLREFFGDQPVAAWFNPSAPRIKQGQIKPEALDEQQAINLMLSDPLLIRRPLMRVGERKMAGFDERQVAQWLGLPKPDGGDDIERCPKSQQPDCGDG